jgi:hypothetical protein
MGKRRTFTTWLSAAALAVACGGTSSNGLLGKGHELDAGSSCAPGQERCACYGNDTCNAGLTCASELCVRLPGSTTGVDAGVDASHGAATSSAGGDLGAGGNRTGSGGTRASGGSASPGAGGADETGGEGSGGRFLGTGGTSGAGGKTLPTGGTGGQGSGGAAGTGGTCATGQKYCGGLCTPPAPRVGCGLTGCEPCTLVAPANGYVTCANGQCVFDCLSGYKKTVDKCEGTGAGGTGGAGTCNLPSCPECAVVTGAACCTAAGKCGCPTIPWVPNTCA